MTDAAETADAVPAGKRKGKLGLILGLVGALALGGGGFYAVYAGLVDPAALLGRRRRRHGGAAATARRLRARRRHRLRRDGADHDLAAARRRGRHLRFTGQLEVGAGARGRGDGLMPRILDVLNTYLRAVEVARPRASRRRWRGCGRRCCGGSRS